MAHPILEALYLGLFASTVTQPVDVPQPPVVEERSCSACPLVTVRAPRVVYDWAGGTRSVYSTERTPVQGGTPIVGITEWQGRSIHDPAAG